MPVFCEVGLLSFFINILALAVPVFVMQVYDRVVFHSGVSTLVGLVVGMAIVIGFDFCMRLARARILQIVALRIDVAVGRKLFDKVVTLPLVEIERRPAASWHALFRDVDTVRNTLSGASILLFCDLPFLLLFLGMMFIIAPPVAWVVILVLPAYGLIAALSARILIRRSGHERDNALARDSLIAEMIAGRTTIKALALDASLRPLWEERHARTIENAISRGGLADGYATLGTTLTVATTVAITAIGALAVLDQRLSIGALIAANMLSGRLLGPVTQLVASWRSLTALRQAIDRLGQVFGLASDRRESVVALACPKGELTLEGVSFSYPDSGRPILVGVDVSLRTGVHAIVGPNGSGKSTLLKVALGLYRPSEGRVLLDDADIAQFARSDIANWIGYVPQETVLFSGTLRDNIALRQPMADNATITAAAILAGAHSFIIDLPDGYATDAGEAGRRLSAGQRQRIAIARALLADPPLLLLDEPSNHLDQDGDHDLRRMLERLARRSTVLIVTHSPPLLAACQTISVLDRGRIARTGPVDQLLPLLLHRAPPRSDPPAARAASAPAFTATAATPAPADIGRR
ncbi:MAG: ATP-binding cassette domain-containing protein [Rhodospirillales bacterium]